MRAAAAAPTSGRRAPLRRRILLSALPLFMSVSSGGLARAAESVVPVMLDRAEIMRLPPGTETIVVGNPIIADVTMLKATGQLILTGKGYGDTNLVFLNGHGDIIAEARLRVREAAAMVVVQRGLDRETYACAPRCQPTVTLGDASTFMTGAIGAIQARNNQATGAAATSPIPGAGH